MKSKKFKKVKEVIIEDIEQDVYSIETEKSHLFITTNGLLTHNCLPKDLIALLGVFEQMHADASLLKVVYDKNLRIRKIRDWEKIPFVKSE